MLVGVVIAFLLMLWLVLARNCPSVGFALTSRARSLHRLKNRTAFPKESDFDLRITLDKLLQPGDDTNRWSSDRAAKIQGQVIDVAYAHSEAANCFSLRRARGHAKSKRLGCQTRNRLVRTKSTSISWPLV